MQAANPLKRDAAKRRPAKRRDVSKRLSHPGLSSADLRKQLDRQTHELREAREQQAALAEVLGAISRSRFELQPILESVVRTAARLCRAKQAVTFRLEGGCLPLRAWP